MKKTLILLSALFISTYIHSNEDSSSKVDLDWNVFFESSHTPQVPRDTVIKAVARFQDEGVKPGLAVDLGCGAGIDVSFLVKNGWNVLAMDYESSAEKKLFDSIPSEKRGMVEFVASSYQDFVYPKNVQLVNASFALPYCPPEHFDDVMKKMTSAIAVEGRFAGQFLGLDDSWSFDKSIVFLSQDQVLKYFEGFDIEYFFEDKRFGETFVGPKYWHIYHIIAKKRNATAQQSE